MEPDSYPQEDETRASTRPVWMRGLFMLLLLIAFGIAQGLLWLLAIVQFLWLIFSGEANTNLASFGKSLSLWLAETARFVTCASDAKPFPWAPWPAAG
jgi:Domain of unknown function (DUF4389)